MANTVTHGAVQKKVSEYSLPATVQTHEVAVIGEDLLLITQQERNALLKVALHPISGNPLAASQFTLNGSTYDGCHGLCTSKAYSDPQCAWVTLQFDNSLILVDPQGVDHDEPPREVKRIKLQKPLRGPHVVIEDGDYLWVTCKDSGHVAMVNHTTGSVEKSYVCSRRPIFVAVTTGYVYASLDESSKIFVLDKTNSCTTEIDIPVEHGSTPVGLITGPDGHVWFTLLGGSSGGSGTFGRIIKKEITWCKLNTAKTAGLLHLAFDSDAYTEKGDLKLWLLGSSIGSAANLDAVFTVHLQQNPHDIYDLRVGREEATVLPTQYSMAHRVLKHSKGLFVTELDASILAHIKGSAVKGLDKDDQSADAYALWGLGVHSKRVVYRNELLEDCQRKKRKTLM